VSDAIFRGSLLPSLALRRAADVACSSKPAADDAPAPPPPASGPTFTRTVVELTPGHPPAVAVVPVTLEEQQARIDQAKPDTIRSRTVTPSCSNPGVVADTSCKGEDLWLFDQPNHKGNELCVRNMNSCELDAGLVPWSTLVLSDMGRECTYLPPHGVVCFSNWSGAVRSLWAGDQGAVFFGPGSSEESVKAWQQELTVSAVVQSAGAVGLGSP
jgi:hypothetical protein